MNYKFLTVIILLILSFSCKTKKKVIEQVNLPSQNELFAETILDSLSNSQLEYRTLFMKFSATIQNEQGEMASTGSLKIFKDSLIILSLTPMLGIELMRARITKNEIVVLNRLKKTYYLEGIENIHKLFGVSLSFSEFEKILTNQIFTYPDSLNFVKDYKYLDFSKNESDYFRFLFDGIISDTIVYKHSVDLDIAKKRYNSFELKFSNLNKSVRTTYTNFKEINKIFFPYLIEFQTEALQSKTSLNLEISKIELDRDLNFAFSIPKKYKKQKLLSF